ncbi:hypothetical protein [Streptomyces sp. NPDC020917]|uniref:hypothetical protein n=1 Tax=Streptomyces sp. NPDC020917 TaxID=3365102 RepID=UPI00379EBFE2
MNSPPPAPQSATRYLWILVAFLFSLIVALAAGILRASTGTGLAETILYGGTAFAASMGLCLAVLSAAGQL